MEKSTLVQERRRGIRMEEQFKTEQIPEPERPKLRLKRDAPGKPCPRCGEKMDEEAVVCLRCGWNIQAGKRMKSVEAAIRRKRVLEWVTKLVVTVVIVGAVVAVFRWLQGHRNDAERWLEAGREQAQALVGGRGEAPAETGESDVVRERLDRELPMWKAGDKVELEKTNGSVLLGVLITAENGSVSVETTEGVRTTGMDCLSGRSRARVDEAYREEVLRKLRNKP